MRHTLVSMMFSPLPCCALPGAAFEVNTPMDVRTSASHIFFVSPPLVWLSFSEWQIEFRSSLSRNPTHRSSKAENSGWHHSAWVCARAHLPYVRYCIVCQFLCMRVLYFFDLNIWLCVHTQMCPSHMHIKDLKHWRGIMFLAGIGGRS